MAYRIPVFRITRELSDSARPAYDDARHRGALLLCGASGSCRSPAITLPWASPSTRGGLTDGSKVSTIVGTCDVEK
jgi:hypothetical protein